MGLDGQAAIRTAGTGSDDREPGWNAVDYHIQKAANHTPQNE